MADIDGASFLSGANAEFIADLYARFLDDPGSIDESWRRFFAEIGDDGSAALAELRAPCWKTPAAQRRNGATASAPTDEAALRQATANSIHALQLIRAYRVRGHLEADLDPLGLDKRGPYPELDYRSYGFSETDLDREIFLNGIFDRERASLREIIDILRRTYCGKIGVEYMHIQVPAERVWIQEKFERRQRRHGLSTAEKKNVLEILTTTETFERFLDRRYTGTKRFGIEGAESLMPALEAILRRGSELGVKEFVIGMPHRGRLNVLANFVGKPYAAIFSEFQGNSTNPEHVHGSGDVKYHLGTSADREVDGTTVHLSLTANPSHLEAVNPVVLGKVRAKQQQRGDEARREVAGILMHGDAAFAGQGLVAESLELSELTGFCTGGTIHVIVNNQIGFTTAPSAARSSPYPSDVAKGVQAPIFHVNGDDPEAVVEVAKAAADYRHQFGKDVVIDLFCYRRHGHNEGDEPAFTQPLMYRTIARHPTTRQLYAQRLVAEGSHPRGRGRGNGGPVCQPARKRIRGGEKLSPEQGRLARGRLGRAGRSPRR